MNMLYMDPCIYGFLAKGKSGQCIACTIMMMLNCFAYESNHSNSFGLNELIQSFFKYVDKVVDIDRN